MLPNPTRLASALRVALCLSALAAGCGTKAKRGDKLHGEATLGGGPSRSAQVLVVDIRVQDRTSPNEQVVRLTKPRVRGIIDTQLSELDGFSRAAAEHSRDPRAYRLRLAVELQSLVGSKKGKAAVLTTLELKRLAAPPDEPGYLKHGLAERIYKVAQMGNLQTLYEELLGTAVGQALQTIADELRLRHAPPAQVAHVIRTGKLEAMARGWSDRVDAWQPLTASGALTLEGDLGLGALIAAWALARATPESGAGEGPDLREVAIKAAALRRLKETVPDLLAVLSRDKRERLRDRCLGALAEIRDVGAVPALTRWATRGAADEQRIRKVIGVLEQIGGTEAEAFLELQADAGEDPEVQALAKETLERLRQRGGRGGAGATNP